MYVRLWRRAPALITEMEPEHESESEYVMIASFSVQINIF